ncbi:hypothetical protein A8F94_15805 [Bacillus sp. FJAT-27225]|uniref:hypothetical protein n=1 Tax=Bacillus sp. FJAT-27225 TaxID=1743144 RepID=UPI00080C2C7B|nr:hypothetical protein [Bacillus sp. FJAT-27225]OCA84183.1 hypothetical protein A8F94_15805 [Bacillus sp. FJAT-27225]
MKLVYRALVWSAAFHILYFAVEFAIGYIKTLSYKPELNEKYGHAHSLQSEFAFGYTGSPLFFLATYFVIAVIIAVFLFKLKRKA